MLKLVKLQDNHIKNIETDFDFSEHHRSLLCRDNTSGYAALLDNHVVAIGGISCLWEGVAEGWFIIGNIGKLFPLALARIVRLMVDRIIKENNLFRLQVEKEEKNKKAVRFIKWLKFTEEGIMKKFGPDGVDYIRYAWVK
jgi:hypothetical protein